MDLSILKLRINALGFPTSPGANDHIISFMYEGGSYFLDVDPTDRYYVRIGFPSFWTFTPFDHQRVLIASNKVTESVKVVKVYSIGQAVFCSAELFMEDEEAVIKFFMRYLKAIQGAAKSFSQQMALGF